MTAGKFITFEGGEGAGKTTQSLALQDALARAGIDAVITREPGGTPYGEEVRSFLLHGGARTNPGTALAETLLFFSARADHVERVIRPALAAGKWVICDRFTDSTRAYQGAASGVDGDFIRALDRLVVAETQPALTLILDLPAATGLARADTRRRAASGTQSKDTFEARDLAFHERLRNGFLAIARSEPGRCAVVDADALPADVTRSVLAAVTARLGVRLGGA
jgi:dTMP kinase